MDIQQVVKQSRLASMITLDKLGPSLTRMIRIGLDHGVGHPPRSLGAKHNLSAPEARASQDRMLC